MMSNWRNPPLPSDAAIAVAKQASDAYAAKQARPEGDDARIIATARQTNPWRRDSRNLTAQMVIARRDPGLADTLKAAARHLDGGA